MPLCVMLIPSRDWIAAPTTSPRRAFGTGKVQDSATAGWRCNAPSTSKHAIFSPPIRIIFFLFYHGHEAILICVTQVTSFKPFILKCLSRGIWFIQVPAHITGTCHRDFSNFPCRYLVSNIVQNLQILQRRIKPPGSIRILR